MLAECISYVIRNRIPEETILAIYAGRYGHSLETVGTDLFNSSDSHLLVAGSVLGTIHLRKREWSERPFGPELESEICDSLTIDASSDPLQPAFAALAVMNLAFNSNRPETNPRSAAHRADSARFSEIGHLLTDLLSHENIRVGFAAAWALAWVAHKKPSLSVEMPPLLAKLAELWQRTSLPDVRYVAAWAINCLGAVPRDAMPFGESTPALLALIVGAQQIEGRDFQFRTQRLAALVIAYYLASPYTDSELASMLRDDFKRPSQQTRIGQRGLTQHVDDLLRRLPNIKIDDQISFDLGDDSPETLEIEEEELNEVS